MPSKKATRPLARKPGVTGASSARGPAEYQTPSAEEQSRTRQDRTLRVLEAKRRREAELVKQGYVF